MRSSLSKTYCDYAPAQVVGILLALIMEAARKKQNHGAIREGNQVQGI